GRVRFVVSDLRSEKSPIGQTDDEDKVMMGATQEAWWRAELLAAKAAGQVIAWISSVPYIETTTAGSDKWGGYNTERVRHANFIKDNGLADRMFGINGDLHCLAMYDPLASSAGDYAIGGGANFPWFNCA